MKRLVLITGVSASWKTTLWEELLRRWWNTVINFTTRPPRNKDEVDDYVFLTKEQFLFKISKWDFLEHVIYNWNFYWISRCIPKWNTFAIVEPEGRRQILECYNDGIIDWKLDTYFLDITPELQKERLTKRWDASEDIKKREKDFIGFQPTDNCEILNWEEDANILADIIEGNG